MNTIDDHNKSKTYKVTIVTRCKKNLAVYTMPHLRPSGKRGPTPKKGSRLYFDKLFDLDEDELRNAIDSDNEAIYWTQKEIIMYGKVENVKYVALNLIWAKAHCRLLRFVLVKYGDVESILVTTDLLMDAETVIRLYCTREKIETTFRELNQRVNAFSSRFWTKAMPKLNHFRKKTDPDPLEEVTSVEGRKIVALTVRAIELYGAISCIAMGLIQIISLSFEWKKSDFGWQRTSVNIDRPSEECVQKYLRKRIGGKIIKNSNNKIGQLLHSFLDQYELEDAEKIMLTA